MQKQITAFDILNDEKVQEIYGKIEPKFDFLVTNMAKKHQCFELAEAMLLIVSGIVIATSTHICDDDYLAARKLIDEVLDLIGDPMNIQEGEEQ